MKMATGHLFSIFHNKKKPFFGKMEVPPTHSANGSETRELITSNNTALA
ncbi:hypothetical protein [Paenibacillus periandrae]|nr:hypothetical protein [Paenibacillus periandrae]